jgi:mRNA-degrading endonuclease RelE of RelBE toxin-antitoxin system
MYEFIISKSVEKSLRKYVLRSPSIDDKLTGLSTNPYSIALPTEISCIGKYYTNAGRYCVLFNVDETKKEIIVLNVVLSPLLHKIMASRINPNFAVAVQSHLEN